MRKLICTLAVLLSACTTTGKWAHQSGAESAKTDMENDTAIVRTDWGYIKLYPKIINRLGFEIEVSVHNESDKTIDFKSSQIGMQAEDGQVIDQLTNQEFLTKINAGMAFTGMMVGGGHQVNNAATLAVTEKALATLIKDGPIPSKSSRKGFVVFDVKDEKPATFTFRLYPNLVAQELQVKFGPSDAVITERKIASQPKHW